MKEEVYKKCVLSICDIHPKKYGSFEEFLIELTKKLNENDFEHLIILRGEPIKKVEELLLNKGAKIEIIKPSKHSIVNFLKFYTLIKKVHPDIVNFHFYPVYTIVNYLKYIFNIKIVYTDHMGGRRAKTFTKKVLRKFYYYISFKLFDIGIDKIVCVSNFVKSKYSKEYGINSKKLCIIYNGINIKKFQKNTQVDQLKNKYNIKNEFVVTCIGLRRDKGPHCLIKAAPLILKEIPNTKFILVGEGECKSYIKELINNFGIKDNVVLTGNVPSIEDIYNISSCVVIPSLFEEAFCFVAVEAMATETPIIAYDSGAIKEVSPYDTYIIKKDYRVLAKSVITYLSKNDIDQHRIRQYVLDNFLIDECANKFIDMYKKLLGE